MKPIWQSYVLVVLIGAVLYGILADNEHVASFVLGAGVTGLNWAALGFVWSRILQQKSIAIATGVIVIKYALLGIGLFLIARWAWVDALALGAGIATVVPTALLAALTHKHKQSTAR